MLLEMKVVKNSRMTPRFFAEREAAGQALVPERICQGRKVAVSVVGEAMGFHDQAKEKRRGPSRDPCGMPIARGRGAKVDPLHGTCKILPEPWRD